MEISYSESNVQVTGKASLLKSLSKYLGFYAIFPLFLASLLSFKLQP